MTRIATNHPWERAGLGNHPYRVVGVETRVGPIHLPNGIMVGAPGQAMGTCDYCGQGIKECFKILAADGKRFEVGCDCVRRAYTEVGERVPNAVKAFEREKRQAAARAKAKRVRERLDEILAAPPAVLTETKVVTPWGEERTLLEDLERVLLACGDAGRARHLKRIEKVIAGN
jgi:hypothetical protein